jgi:hypothetical protein
LAVAFVDRVHGPDVLCAGPPQDEAPVVRQHTIRFQC